MQHEGLVNRFGLDDPRYALRYSAMIGSMLAKIRESFTAEFRVILGEMRRNYIVEDKIHLTRGSLR